MLAGRLSRTEHPTVAGSPPIYHNPDSFDAPTHPNQRKRNSLQIFRQTGATFHVQSAKSLADGNSDEVVAMLCMAGGHDYFSIIL